MNLSLHSNFSQVDTSPTVLRLLKIFTAIKESTSCLQVLDIFNENLGVFALPVVSLNNIPIGIVERHSFIEIFIQPYTKDLYGKKPISEYMNSSPIIVSKETAIDDVAKIIIDAGMQHMVNGFIITDNGHYIGIANGHDLLNEISERKQTNLFYLAHFDNLTKLPNRNLFMDRLDAAITEAARYKTQLGLLFIDLDKFKHFNDSMGHAFGDQILSEVAMRLHNCIRESDTLARLSGDEFTILVGHVNSQQDLNDLCTRILNTMKNPVQIMGREVFISVSIGTAMYPDDDIESAGLLIKADAAMYEAKRNGRNTYRSYIAGMNLYSIDRMTLETDMRRALERNEFELFYQPQIALDTGEVVGSEALIRWRHPEKGLITPLHFIGIAEETGLIIPIGKWVIEEACRQHTTWIKNGLNPMRMSVNISAIQFYQSDFIELITSITNEHSMHPSYLELELTESLFMQDVDSVIKILHELHTLGVKLAVDDFGTGYSNLSYLRKFKIDRLKVDQSFVRNIDFEPINAEIVKAIAALGKSLSLELVAEGVETDNELALVQSCGCEFVQGYRYSKPLAGDFLEMWMKEYQSNFKS